MFGIVPNHALFGTEVQSKSMSQRDNCVKVTRPQRRADERWEGRNQELPMPTDQVLRIFSRRPWNKDRLVGQKRPLRPKDVWAIRVRLELGGLQRDLALFDLAIDSKLRACDLVRLKVQDIYIGDQARERATVVQQKTNRPVQFEITGHTRPRSTHGLICLTGVSRIIFSPAGSKLDLIYRLDSMHDWFISG